MEFLSNYGLFLAKSVTVLVVIFAILGMIATLIARNKSKEGEGKLVITKLNDEFEKVIALVDENTLEKTDLKKRIKEKKAASKAHEKEETTKARLFVIDFDGDMRASAVDGLRKEINAILLTVKPRDQVLLRLESPGGVVNGYGLAASQLQRLVDAKIKLTIAIDKMAASGGYMMACVADHIIAAPFAIVGSIGVVAQLPNFHRLLKKNHVDYEMITAGAYKRTLTLFGENTAKGRDKMQEEVDDAHELFKTFIHEHRPDVDIVQVSTGEHWFGSRALEYRLVDEIKTSDDFLLNAKEGFDLFHLEYKTKQPLAKRLGLGLNNLLGKWIYPDVYS